jgi:type IV secretory pathway VirB10-like protein
VIRLAIAGFLALILAALATADGPKPEDTEPPVRLKKKVRPVKKAEDKPAPKKDQPKEKKEAEPKEPEPPDQADNEKEILERIGKNLRESTERLERKDTGEGTRQAQRDVVKDLDALIAHNRKQQQQQQQQDQPSNPGASGRKSKDQRQASGQSSRPPRERKNRPGNPRRQSNPSTQANKSNRGGAGKTSSGEATKTAESQKERWGELPETLRMEMDAYSRERFMSRYSELLKQYYSTIAERGRRGKEDDR